MKHELIANQLAELTGTTVKAGQKGFEVVAERYGQKYSTTIYFHPELSPTEYLVHVRTWTNALDRLPVPKVDPAPKADK